MPRYCSVIIFIAAEFFFRLVAQNSWRTALVQAFGKGFRHRSANALTMMAE